jgi:hypothetical protein
LKIEGLGITPKTISLAQCRSLLEAHDYESFLDAVETEDIEFKGEPYRLELDPQKQELAKDVSGLANAGGGVILIGFKTTKDAAVLGDYVTELRPIPASQFRAEQYQSIIQEWIYPPPTVTLSWLPSGEDRGFAAVEVSSGDLEHSPHLIKRVVSDDGKRVEVVFGYVQRRQTNVQPSSVHQIHALLRSGLRMHEIGTQYSLIQDTLQQLVEAQSRTSEAKSAAGHAALKAAEFDRDRNQALAAGEFEAIPNLLLAAYPSEPVRMRGLFDPTESDLIRVLQDPPKLNGNGWDLSTGAPIENVHGRLRRGVKPGWKLLQLTRDGVLLFLARGDEGFLSWWSRRQEPDGPLFIVPFILAHCVYAFSLFARQIFEHAVPQPNVVTYTLQLRNMGTGKKGAMLHPKHMEPNKFILPEFYRQMPYPSESFQVEVPFDALPGEISYELVARVFEWFGFDRDKVPYSRSEGGKFLIDDLSLFKAT